MYHTVITIVTAQRKYVRNRLNDLANFPQNFLTSYILREFEFQIAAFG